MIQHEFYLERAAEARASASSATLGNIRDRWLRAEASWTEMAARRRRADAMHTELIAEKASERADLRANALGRHGPGARQGSAPA